MRSPRPRHTLQQPPRPPVDYTVLLNNDHRARCCTHAPAGRASDDQTQCVSPRPPQPPSHPLELTPDPLAGGSVPASITLSTDRPDRNYSLRSTDRSLLLHILAVLGSPHTPLPTFGTPLQGAQHGPTALMRRGRDSRRAGGNALRRSSWSQASRGGRSSAMDAARAIAFSCSPSSRALSREGETSVTHSGRHAEASETRSSCGRPSRARAEPALPGQTRAQSAHM